MDVYSWLVIVITLLLSGFFSGLEMAFVSSSRLRIELKRKKGSKSAELVNNYYKEQGRFLSTILIGNNLVLVVFGIYLGQMLTDVGLHYGIGDQLSEFWVLLLQTIIGTSIILVFGEFLPKSLFRLKSDEMLLGLIYPFQAVYWLLWPAVRLVNALGQWVLKWFSGGSHHSGEIVFSKIDLDHYLSESAAMSESDENEVDTEILKNAMEFENVKARECMVPRNEIQAVELNDSLEELQQKFIETGHSRILVYQDTIDNIVGYVHQVELFKKPVSVRAALIPILIAHETMSALDLLTKLISSRKSLALIVDELGGTAGIVTLEDLMEEIFGEIDDEHDTQELTEMVLNDGGFIFSARLEVDYLNEKYKLNIPEGEYSTLGGYIIFVTENIPALNEVIEDEKYRFTILKTFGNRLDEIKMEPLNN